MPPRIETFRDALAIARAAGRDEGNRRARRDGRDVWNAADHDHAVATFHRVIRLLGFGDGRYAPEDTLATVAGRDRAEARRTDFGL